jgi:hypothetical protein
MRPTYLSTVNTALRSTATPAPDVLVFYHDATTGPATSVYSFACVKMVVGGLGVASGVR